jgi:hypothetical protein
LGIVRDGGFLPLLFVAVRVNFIGIEMEVQGALVLKHRLLVALLGVIGVNTFVFATKSSFGMDKFVRLIYR